MTKSAIWQVLTVSAMALVATTASVAGRQDPQPAGGQQDPQPAPTVRHESAPPTATVDGRALYEEYCAVCHGKDATGKGPAAAAMKTPPSDLTTIAARNKGKFNPAAVSESILGQERSITAHGTPEMPIWGPVFRTLSSDPAVAKLRVSNLVKYIESLQVK